MKTIAQMNIAELAVVWVAREREVDCDEVERWSMQEGEAVKFQVFRKKCEEEEK